jgi:hypothetical protein
MLDALPFAYKKVSNIKAEFDFGCLNILLRRCELVWDAAPKSPNLILYDLS